jgi:crotonobetainyl-CoA:carnitine CoA-transferase CaiB-like acyl-CoA transferase
MTGGFAACVACRNDFARLATDCGGIMTEHAELPLEGIRILDLTRVRAGPTAVRQLADWGADVIKIEQPGEDGGTLGGGRYDPDFQNLHRNKRSMTLNLKAAAGLEIFRRLTERADVVVENYRPDVKHRLGIDYEALSKINSALVYCSISGFGQDGPYGHLPGFDQVAQGMGGLMSITGLPGQGPVRAGIPIADLSAGLFAANGILIALFDRTRTGRGRWVQTSLLQAQVQMLDFQAERWLMKKEVPQQAGNDHPTAIPTGVFRTTDGHINIAATGTAIYERFCRCMGREDWLTDERFRSPGRRSHNRAAMNAEIEAITRTRPSAEWIALFNEAGVPAGPINTIDQVFADPQVQHLGMAAPVHHPVLGDVELVAQAVQFHDVPFGVRTPTPEYGEHTAAILAELGYDADAVRALQQDGVI